MTRRMPQYRVRSSLCRGLLLLWLAGGGLATATAAEDWPAYQHDTRRTGFTPERLDPSGLSVHWTWDSPQPPKPAWYGPAKWDAYAGQRDLPSMRSYDLVFHPIAVGDSVFFGSSTDDSVYCLNAGDGALRWRFTTDGPVRGAPTFAEGRLYVGSDDGYVYCLDAHDGTLLWKYRPVDPEQRILNDGRFISTYPCRTGVLVDGGMAYAGFALLPWQDSWLCAVDAETGSADGPDGFVRRLDGLTLEGMPAATQQWLVFPQGRLAPRVFLRADGQDQGMLKKSGGGSVLVATLDGQLIHGPATDTRRGGMATSRLDSREIIATHGRGNAVAVADATFYLLTDESLSASDLAERKTLWNVDGDCSDALIAAGNVLFTGGDDQVAAWSREDGSLLWHHPVQGRARGLAVARGRLLVSTDEGRIHAFAAGQPSAQSPEAAAQSPEARTEPAPEAVATTAEHIQPAPAAGDQPREIESISDESLIGRWVFQRPHVSARRVVDLAGNLDGRLADDPRLATAGKSQALMLDGRTQRVRLTDDLARSGLPKQALSAAAWVRIDRPQAWGSIIGAIQDNGDYERGWLLGFRKDRFALAVCGQDGPGRLTYLTADKPFQTGRWYHVCGTYDGSEMRLVVNGRLAAVSTAQRGPIDYPPKAFYELGAYHDDNEDYLLEGQLHEVRLYDRSLKVEEIGQQYQKRNAHLPQSVHDTRPHQLAAGPWLQFTAPDEAIVRWRTRELSPSRLKYWQNGISMPVEDAARKREHAVRLTGLRHNRVVPYVIHVQNGERTVTTDKFECETFFNYTVPKVASPYPDSSRVAADDLLVSAAESILARTNIRSGICLVLGAENGRLAYELARNSELRLIVLETDLDCVNRLRDVYLEAGLYGTRVSVHHVENLEQLPIVSSCANLVVSERMLVDGRLPAIAREVKRVLRPDGGVACWGILKGHDSAGDSGESLRSWWAESVADATTERDSAGTWCIVRRGPLDGTGEWSHLYGSADNSAYGGEQLGGVTSAGGLRVQWLGRPGPRYQADRNGRKPSPLSTSGRLFLQGLNRIAALDVYNGTILWSLEIPGFERFNMPRDCGNWCADETAVFAVVRDRCLEIDAASGRVLRMHETLPATADTEPWDWGYVARHDDLLLGSVVRAGTAWTNFWGSANAGWYDARNGPVTFPICSDHLFARDRKSGHDRWDYSGGVILNSTITVADNCLYFVECRHAEVKQLAERRIGDPRLWQQQYLVALDADTGSVRWERPLDIPHGDVMLAMAHGENRLVITASTGGRHHVHAFSDDGGDAVWQHDFPWSEGKGDHGRAMSRPAIVGGRVYVRPQVFQLQDGTPLAEPMPQGHCGTYACVAHALVYRAGNVTIWDPMSNKTSSFARLRPDCWLSTIPAAGMLLSPEGGGGCSCGNWLETSIGFIPDKSTLQPPGRPRKYPEKAQE